MDKKKNMWAKIFLDLLEKEMRYKGESNILQVEKL